MKTRELTPTQFQNFLKSKATERSKLLAEADRLSRAAADIERNILAPAAALATNTVTRQRRSRGPRAVAKPTSGRAKKGEFDREVLALLDKNGGKIKNSQIVEALGDRLNTAYTSAYLARMERKGLIKSTGRAEWEAVAEGKNGKRSKAKA